MYADKHESQALIIETGAFKLDPHTDAPLYIEGLFGAAAHWICAGLDWRGQKHSDKHQQHDSLLKSAGAPPEIPTAWRALEDLRAGDWYGGRTNGARTGPALRAYNVIKNWALAGKPSPPDPATPTTAP